MIAARDTRIACVDVGGTNGQAQVLGWLLGPDGLPSVVTLSRPEFCNMTKHPNVPEADYSRIYDMLSILQSEGGGFDAICVGFAGTIGKDGTILAAGSLPNWVGMNLGELLERDFDVPAVVADDSTMIAAAEIVFGVLRQPGYYGQSGLFIAPGTGVAAGYYLFIDGKYHIFPTEASHVHLPNEYIDAHVPSELCGCRRVCIESRASGRALEYGGTVDPSQLSDKEVCDRLAGPLGSLVRSLVVHMPMASEVAVVTGGIVHKRPKLMDEIELEAKRQIGEFLSTPKFVLSKYSEGNIVGSLAHWLLVNGLV